MKKSFFYFIPALALLFASCAKEPTITSITATINGYTVSFTAVVTDATSYNWDFGDGNISTEAAPVYEYSVSGTFNVKLTVEGKGGQATLRKEVKILPSFNEMLTGGPDAPNGKTWVLSSAYTAGVDGASVVDNSMMVLLPSSENILTVIGLGEEYDNEYTFYSDGRYKMDNKNGSSLTTGLYGLVNGIVTNRGNENNSIGLCAATFAAPASATWALHEDNLVVEAIINPTGTDVQAPHESRTITGKKWVSLSEGAYFGILDAPTTRKFIVKEITPNKMSVALFICGYYLDPAALEIPSFLFHLTFVTKK
ncbi:MAG: PKD domain-containing protein [Bacteroidia bacterium]|nr:PKD domain-containing protein [Bacteroidia bacterium]